MNNEMEKYTGEEIVDYLQDEYSLPEEKAADLVVEKIKNDELKETRGSKAKRYGIWGLWIVSLFTSPGVVPLGMDKTYDTGEKSLEEIFEDPDF